MSDDVDLVLIANCNYDGSDHLELARPGLEKGVPTFIDKPFAHCIADVRAILELANENNAPVMSLSMLQTNPAVVQLVRRLDEVGRVTFGTITCASTHLAALIHAISIAHHVFGTGIRSVSCLKAPNHTVYHLHYGDTPGRPEHGVVINCGVADFRFTEMFTHVFGPEGAIQGLVLNDFNACEGSAIILEFVKDMVRTGRPHPLGRGHGRRRGRSRCHQEGGTDRGERPCRNSIYGEGVVPNLRLAAEGDLTSTLDKMREFMEIYLWRYVVDNRLKMVERAWVDGTSRWLLRFAQDTGEGKNGVPGPDGF